MDDIQSRKMKIIMLSLNESKKLLSSVNVLPPTFEIYESDETVCKIRKKTPVRIKNYIERVIRGTTDKQFQSHFRLTRACYQQLLPIINNLLLRDNNLGRPPIDTEKQLLSVLWLLATPDSYRSVGERFNLGKSSLSMSFTRIIRALNSLAPRVITWPIGPRRNRIKEKFRLMAGIPNVIGAVDGTFIPIKAPYQDPEVYVTRKCSYALTLQSICDSEMKFTDCYVGYPGSVSDTRIFRNSDIYHAVIGGSNFFDEEEFIVGDKAYPLLSWCISPYVNRGHMTEAQRNFNLKVSQTRQIIERTFALLFGRFRRLKFLDMNRLDMIPTTVLAACVLHNFCLDNADPHLHEYMQEGFHFVEGNEELEIGNTVNVREHIDERHGVQRRDQLCRFLFRVRNLHND